MKNLKRNLLCITLGLSLTNLFQNCSKDRIEPEPEPEMNSYSSPNTFMDQYKQPEQEYLITEDGTGPIIGLQGTKLWAGKNIFMHQNGDSVAYPFTIKLVELYTPKDIILYRMPTVAGGKLLTTDGEIRVRAFKDTEELLLKPFNAYLASMPSDAPSANMEIFYGKTNGSVTDWTNNVFEVNANPGTDSISANADSLRYDLSVPNLGWINCDYFYSFPGSKTNITFTSSVDDLTNVAKFLYFKDINSIMQVYSNVSGDVPVGADVTVICFAVGGNGKMFYYKNDLNISSGQSVTVTLSETTEAALLTLLENL